MSCSCGCSPCNCQPRPSVCCTPTVESISYTYENGNLIGIGVFDNETDYLVQFRGVYSDNASLVISLDAPNNAIKFSFDPDALITDIPDATTTQRGIGETATNAEAQAKAATDKFITPSNFAAMASTTTFAGLVELATDAETIAGVSTTLAVTPAGLAAVGATNTTTTWPDAVTRAGADPSFAGQLGVQLDTDIPWLSRSAVVGGFDTPIFVGRGSNVLAASSGINMNGNAFSLSNGSFGTDGTVVTTITEGSWTFETCAVSFGTSSTIDFGSDTVLSIDGVSITDGLLGSDSGGNIFKYDLYSFLSSYGTQTGYTTFSNSATIRTCDTATVTLQQLAQIVGTLITDLKAAKLPSV